MPRSVIPTVLGVVISAALVTGCTVSSQGQPQPQPAGTTETTATDPSSASPPTSTSQSGGQLPTDGAPKVKNPLDASRYQQNPCQMLTPGQLQELNLGAQGEPGEGPLGLACEWRNRDSGGNIHIQWGDKNPRGLSGDYAAHKAGRYAYFIEYPDIEGFPGVAADLSDRRDQGGCIVTVGVTDQLDFQVGLQLSLRNIGQRDPCEVAVLAAGMMLKTMKAGG